MSDIQPNHKLAENLQGKTSAKTKNKKLFTKNGTVTNYSCKHGNKQAWPSLTVDYDAISFLPNPVRMKANDGISNEKETGPLIVNTGVKKNASTSKELMKFDERLVRNLCENRFKHETVSVSENCIRAVQKDSSNCPSVGTVPNDCASTSSKKPNNIDDKNRNEDGKQSWSVNRRLAKEEKCRKREEEVRRQIISPKSEHFKMIDSKFKDLVDSTLTGHSSGSVSKMKDVNSLNPKNSRRVCDFQLNRTLAEFPDLHSSNKFKFESDKSSIKQNSNFLKQFSVTNCATSATINESSNINSNLNIKVGNSDNKQFMKRVTVNKDFNIVGDHKNKDNSNVKRRIKKGAPIEFSLINALQLIQVKNMKQQSCYKKSNYKSIRVLPKKYILSGNNLDSDNPVRRKGKCRENKKKRYTKLKRCLINERQLRKCLMSSTSKTFEGRSLSIDSNLDKGLLYQLVKNSKQSSVPNYKQELSTSNDTYDDMNDVKNIEVGIKNINPQIFLHSRKFRPYCDQWPIAQMQDSVCNLIKTIVRFQDRHHANDPIKAYARRRYVCGFHEVLRFVRLNKAKLIFIATDIDCGNGEDDSSLMDCVKQLTAAAETFSIPYVYSGTRWSMRNTLKKKRPISCAAILNYEGAEEMYKNVISLLPQVKSAYREKLKAVEVECGLTEDVKDDVTGACIRSMLDRLTVNDIDEREPFRDGNNLITTNLKEKISNDCPFMNAILKFSEK